MRLGTYRFEDGIRAVRVEGDVVVDLGRQEPLMALLEHGLGHDGPRQPLDTMRLLAPIPQPPMFLGVGLNYRDHAREVGRELGPTPAVFAKLHGSVAPPYGKVASDFTSFDYEGELGLVIGRRCHRVTAAQAADYIAGYTIVNDFSAREFVKPDTLVLGKSGRGHGPFGPWLTTDVPDPHALGISTHVNGELRQSSNTRELHVGVFAGRMVEQDARAGSRRGDCDRLTSRFGHRLRSAAVAGTGRHREGGHRSPRPYRASRRRVMIKHEPVDVVIMGAGAAGALFAARLAKAGRRVVVLEAGRPWAMTDLVSSRLWSRRLKWSGPPVLPGGSHPFGHNMSTGQGFGGAALHHYAGWPRLHPEDFTLRSDQGSGLDWPFGYDKLRPHYDAIQAEVGISGDADAEIWRPPGAPYPTPPLQWFAQGNILKAGFEKLGLHVSPAPMAVNSVEFEDRPPCVYDGWCDAGCPTGALANPLATHLPAAQAAGATLTAHATVTRIAIGARGRATGLHWRDASDAEHDQSADIVILAGAAVQNARLLLASGVINALVGRYFNGHSIANVHGLFDAEIECHWGLTAGTLMSQEGYGKHRDGDAFGSITWGIAPAVKPNDLIGIAMTRPDLSGAALDTFIRRASRHLGQINGIVEQLPVADNRIELTPTRDRHGVPQARIVHSPDPRSLALWAAANAEGLRIVRAAGATEAWTSPQRAFAHVSGGTVIGRDPATAVANSYGQLHGVPNLVAAGGGLFPSIGAVSPTFTVLALADRTAARMIADWASFAA